MGFRIYPDPPSGDPADYGPLPAQRLIRFQKLPEAERPHLHYVDIMLLIGGTGGGKCMKRGTEVLSFGGVQLKVEDVKIGDLLMGPDSKPRKVKSLCRGREEMFEVAPVKGSHLTFNRSHILSLRHTVSKKITNITIDAYLEANTTFKSNHKLYRSECIEFPPAAELPTDPYFLGVWLGDGVAKSTSVTNPEPEIAAWLDDFAASNGWNLHEYVNPKQSSYCPDMRISNGLGYKSDLLRELRALDVIDNKHIPQQYLIASSEDRLKILAGLLDTDGWLHHGFFEITQKSEKLANNIVFLARSLGFAAYMKPVRKSCKVNGKKFTGTYFRTNISGDVGRIPTIVPRKQAGPRKQKKNVLVTGFDIKSIGVDDFYGFTLSGPDQLFVLGDFTVTHNSDGAVGQCAGTLVEWPGSHVIMGAMNFPLLQRTSMEKLKNLFSNSKDWGHKYVERAPTQNDKRLYIRRGKNRKSTCYFLNLENWETIKGIPADVILIEEAPTIKKEQSFDELIGRLRGIFCPYKQIILLANPQLQGSWLYRRFKLEQHRADYKGPELKVGKPCRCQFCFNCIKPRNGGVEVEWKDSNCPRCHIDNVCRQCVIRTRERLKYDGDHCAKCGFRRCPGDQDYHRVVFCNADQNKHNDSTYEETMRGGMSAHQYAMLGQGQILSSKTGRFYPSMSEQNRMPENVPADPDRPLVWSLDFNNHPQCSVILQEYRNGKDVNHLVLDEIIMFAETPEGVAQEFCRRYEGWKGQVLIYGDPNGFSGKVEGKTLDNYEIICNVLKEKGFDYDLRVRPTRYLIENRANTTNWHLNDANGYVRLKINPQCLYLIQSLEALNWNTQGTKEDYHGDREARESEDKTIIFTMSHPSAALGYYLIAEHPQIEWAEPTHFHVESGGKIVQLQRGEVTEYTIHEDDLRSIEEVTADDLGLDDDLISVGGSWSSEKALGSYLRERGLWIGQD